MQDLKDINVNNVYSSDGKNEFQSKLKSIDNSHSNRLIAGIRVNVPDNIDYRVPSFKIETYNLRKPLVCPINSQEVSISKKMRPIHLPEVDPYVVNIRPFDEDAPFVGTDHIARPYNHNHYRNQFLTPVSDMPRIDIDFN